MELVQLWFHWYPWAYNLSCVYTSGTSSPVHITYIYVTCLNRSSLEAFQKFLQSMQLSFHNVHTQKYCDYGFELIILYTINYHLYQVVQGFYTCTTSKYTFNYQSITTARKNSQSLLCVWYVHMTLLAHYCYNWPSPTSSTSVYDQYTWTYRLQYDNITDMVEWIRSNIWIVLHKT